MERKNTFLKVMGLIILIQGIIQLLSVVLAFQIGMQQDVSTFRFYMSIGLTALYGVIAAAGGLTGFRFSTQQDGCKRSFYYGLGLILLTLITIVINLILGEFEFEQIGTLFLPAMFTVAAVMGGQWPYGK
nr:hypothetical protein [uncultured Anaerostipes sp.]